MIIDTNKCIMATSTEESKVIPFTIEQLLKEVKNDTVETGETDDTSVTFGDIVEYLTSLVDCVTVIDLNSREYTETLGNDLSCLMSVEEAIDQARVTLLNTSPGFFGELVRAGFTTYP